MAGYYLEEQSILLAAVQAYIELSAAQETYRIKQAYAKVALENFEVAHNRYKYGELTRYDKASAESKLEKIRADVVSALSNVESAKAAFIKLTGLEPRAVLNKPSAPENLLPKTKEEAIKECLKHNPSIQQTEAAAASAQLSADLNYSQILPSLALTAGVTKSLTDTRGSGAGVNNKGLANTRAANAGLTLTVPLDLGAGQSSIRSAKYTAAQQRLQSIIQRRQVMEQTSQKWDKYEASRAQIKQLKAQVNASKVALEVVLEEYLAGTKTTLEVLVAEQDYFEAQINLAVAEQASVFSAYELLASMGILRASNLGLAVKVFSAPASYKSMSWFGTGIDLDKRFDEQVENNLRMAQSEAMK